MNETRMAAETTDMMDVMETMVGSRARAAVCPPADSSPLIRIRELEAELRNLRSATVVALCQMLDLKDLGTGLHSTRLAEWAVRLGGALGLDTDAVRGVEVAALLHDIGKVGIGDDVLRHPGPLSEDEMELVRKHPDYGWCILRAFPELEQAALFVLHHHERVDGTGYPAGLEGDEIPLGARIVAVIDAFDAMIATRPYRQGLPCDEARRRLLAGSGTQFDTLVVERFLRIAEVEFQSPVPTPRTPAAVSW